MHVHLSLTYLPRAEILLDRASSMIRLPEDPGQSLVFITKAAKRLSAVLRSNRPPLPLTFQC
jgi:hypothetical protein